MLRAMKKDGDEILFDSINIKTHNIKDVVLRGKMNQKINVPPREVCGMYKGNKTFACGLYEIGTSL